MLPANLEFEEGKSDFSFSHSYLVLYMFIKKVKKYFIRYMKIAELGCQKLVELSIF